MCLVLIGGCITQSTGENSAPFDAVMPTADGPTTTETVQTADMSVPFDMGTGESDMAMAFDAETLSPAQLSVVIDGVPIESSHVHDFGRLEQHDVAFQMITLTNIGQRILAITSIELSEGLSVITDTIPAALMPVKSSILTFPSIHRARMRLCLDIVDPPESLEYREFLIDFAGTIRAYIRDVASSNPGFRDALESIRTDAGLVGLVALVVRGRDIIALEGVGFCRS